MPNANHETADNACPSNLYPFDAWLRGRGLTRTTGYRYRRAGLIKAVEIFGRLYLTTEEIKRFETRAVNGEFNKQAKTPSRPRPNGTSNE